jgi:capsular exopolysaccharide synthesis family protein
MSEHESSEGRAWPRAQHDASETLDNRASRDSTPSVAPGFTPASEERPDPRSGAQASSPVARRRDDGGMAIDALPSRSPTEAHLGDYVRVLHKHRWTATSALLVVFGSVTIYTFTATPVYEAKVRLLIETENPNVVSFQEVIEQNKTTNDYYQTQYRMLEGRALARRTLDGAKLWSHPEFAGAKTPGLVTRALRASAEWASGLFGGSENPLKLFASDETHAEARAINRFLENLVVSPVRNSRLVDVRYESRDPGLAAQVANAHVKAYIEQNMEFKFLATKEASDWLAERMAEQRQHLEVGELALQQYREQNDAVSLEERQDIVVQRLADLNAAVTRARTTRIEKEALYRQLRSLQNKQAALDTFPAILSNGFIQQLKAALADLERQQAQLGEKLGERHPDMIKLRSALKSAEAKLEAEIGKAVQSIGNEFQAALAQEQSLLRALEQQKDEALALNRKAIEYGVLQRDSGSNRQMFEALLQRAKETEISGQLKTSNIRIADPAEVPDKPVRPRPVSYLLLALLGGGTLAVGLAFTFECLDNRIKSPEEIKAQLSLPFLGMVPALSHKGSEATSPILNNGVPPSFVEAFRAIRTNVVFSFTDDGCRSLLVTSTGPGEGKTVVAANLAIALAQAGRRVLLFDADLRRPRVHEVFDVEAEPGLSNLLVGQAKASEVVRKSAIADLWLLPAGRVPPNPAELLGSRRFKDFQATLRAHFDWIVLDSPPMMAVTDPAIVAHAADGVLFVIGAEMTTRQAAQSALEQLDAAHARFVGAVLNRVDLKRNSYYYSPYYRPEYLDYYTPAAVAASDRWAARSTPSMLSLSEP